MTLHDVVTLFCVVAIASASPLADQSNDLIVGGLNGPVNFSRPEGERLFYFYVPSTYSPNKPLPFIIYYHGYRSNWTQGMSFNQTNDAEINVYILAFAQGTPSVEPCRSSSRMEWGNMLSIQYNHLC